MVAVKRGTTGDTTAQKLLPIVYGELEPEIAEMAEGNVLAHLIKLRSDGKVKGQKNFTAV